MIKIYEAHSGASSDLRTHLGCISAWSNQGLVAYICERTIEAKLLSVTVIIRLQTIFLRNLV